MLLLYVGRMQNKSISKPTDSDAKGLQKKQRSRRTRGPTIKSV
jgi:hypothetical protein